MAIQAKRNKNSRDKILKYAKDITGADDSEVVDEGEDSNKNNCSNNNNKNQSSNYFSPELTNILLIGISYNRTIVEQFTNDRCISNISQCTDVNGRVIDQCVARDTFRCYVLEATYPNTNIFTVNRCSDIMRLVDNEKDP